MLSIAFEVIYAIVFHYRMPKLVIIIVYNVIATEDVTTILDMPFTVAFK
jgi:hypothetical protein